MELFVVMLLASLSTVIGVMIAFLWLYRSDRRPWHSPTALQDPVVLPGRSLRRPLPFPVPARWMAVRGVKPSLVREVLGDRVGVYSGWSDALARSRERVFFVSAPLDGWTLVIGGALPETVQDVDRAFHFLRKASGALGEIQYFSADRVLNFHSWARLDNGRVTRAYAWAGATLWNEGRPTLEERLLGLRCRAYGEDVEPHRYGEITPEFHNADRVLLLARRWGIDPVAFSEILVHQEGLAEGDRPGNRGRSEDPGNG